MPNTHSLKTWTPYFEDVKSGQKTFEVRKNDRDFQVGDTLILEDFDPKKEKYTGRWIPKEIIYKLADPQFVKDGFVVLGLKNIKF